MDLNSDFELQVYKTNEIANEEFHIANYSVILFEEEWTAMNYPYKNAIELFQSDLHYEKKDYARLFSLIGGYYSKMNTDTNIFYWQKFNERTGELYEDG